MFVQLLSVCQSTLAHHFKREIFASYGAISQENASKIVHAYLMMGTTIVVVAFAIPFTFEPFVLSIQFYDDDDVVEEYVSITLSYKAVCWPRLPLCHSFAGRLEKTQTDTKFLLEMIDKVK